uniref:Retrovirus-related Pol polyprotein LINE-1 n=1 Tax=Aquarana catesbeiana TaxID=8400 RepID=C1C3L7_AQUCT|nr:Retrovirus-related Pol polyprotein LINE-1 [Aquarana catesbeiana]
MQTKPLTNLSLMLRCISLNVKGLNLPEKRSQVLSSLSKHKAHFIFLQETHFRSDAIPKLSNHIYRSAFHATNPDAKRKGISILISKHANFHLSDSLIDPAGRFIFLKGTYAAKPITLANIYCPNEHQVTFFRSTCDLLASFQEGLVLLGGGTSTFP